MKKPSEYTKIEKETIVGTMAYFLLLIIVVIVYDVLTQMIYQRRLYSYLDTESQALFLVSVGIYGVIILGITTVAFIIFHEILAAKERLPKFEKVYHIWNPFNKTRFVMNKTTERPDVVYYLRRPQSWFNLPIPEWIKKRWDKLLLPAFVIIVVVILWLDSTANLEWATQLWITKILAMIVFVVAVILVIYLVTSGTWPNRKAVVTQEEYKEMIPHLIKADNLIWGYAGECFYKSRLWVVSKEEYNTIFASLRDDKIL